MKALFSFLAAACVCIASQALAGAAKVDSPAPMEFADAHLTVVGPNGETTYTPESLEGLGVYGFVTRTPWDDVPVHFEGVLLTDVLAAAGLSDAEAIYVLAENDYQVVIPHSAWTDHEILIATRRDGKPHTRRMRGPLQFVLHMDEDPAAAEKAFEDVWVWMAARIEAAN